MSDRTDISIAPMSPDVLDDIRALYSSAPDGWCWCVAWEVPDWSGWSSRTAEQNRSLREDLWKNGQFHGYVFYSGDEAIGWCRVGPTAVWPKFCQQTGLQPSDAEYAFTCFGLKPPHQAKGLLHEYFEKVILDLRNREVRTVFGFPKRHSAGLSAGDVWTGPVSVFLKAGFSVERMTENRVLVKCELEPMGT